jgi:hypothetical protein
MASTFVGWRQNWPLAILCNRADPPGEEMELTSIAAMLKLQ